MKVLLTVMWVAIIVCFSIAAYRVATSETKAECKGGASSISIDENGTHGPFTSGCVK